MKQSDTQSERENTHEKNIHTVTHAEIYSAFIEKGIYAQHSHYMCLHVCGSACMCGAKPNKRERLRPKPSTSANTRVSVSVYTRRYNRIIAAHNQHSTCRLCFHICTHALVHSHAVQSADIFSALSLCAVRGMCVCVQHMWINFSVWCILHVCLCGKSTFSHSNVCVRRAHENTMANITTRITFNPHCLRICT